MKAKTAPERRSRFSPRSLFPPKEAFWARLEAQADIAHRGAVALLRFRGGGVPGEEIRAELRALEREGDGSIFALRDLLAHAVSTSVEREDIHRLSHDLEAVVHTANHAIRSCVLFGVLAPTPAMERLIETLVESTRVLVSACARARGADWPGVFAEARAVQQLEKEGDAIYRGEMVRLFHDDAVEPKVLLREKEVLSDLERAIDLCDGVAGTLMHVAAKHV